MLKRVIRVVKSVKFLLGAAVFTSLLFLLHFANVSVIFDHHKDGLTVIDRLRTQQVIRTNSVTKQEHKEEIGADVVISESPPLSVLDSVATTNAATPDFELPGALEHPILQLSDEKFRTTPVSEMFEWYGQAEGGGTCAEDFGYKLIEKWRNMKQSYCQPANNSTRSSGSNQLGSSIDCYLIHQTRHHGDGDNLCVMKNVAVDMRLFADDAKTRTVVKQYVDTRHAKQPYIKFPKGFIGGDCSPVPSLWKSNYMPGWNADLTVGAFESTSKQASENKDTAAVCEEWVTHPVIVTQRDTFANFFHDSEDFFNVFIAMAVLDYLPGQVQMFLTDLYPKGPFWDIWSKAYSQGIASSNGRDRLNNNPSTTGALPALTAWDLRQSFQHIAPGKKVCFKELTIGIFGPAAPMTVASWDTPCRRTALVRAYSDYIIRGLQLHAHTHYALPIPSRTIVITYMSRRPSKEWPEKKYCDSENSFFLCELWANFGERKLGRMIRNDPEVVAALKGLKDKTFPNADRIIVNDVDYNVLTFEEQILTDLKTDIMIGPHGAGLMHNIFMRDRAALIELFIDGSSGNRHFHNLANWFGRTYSGVSAANPISIQSLLHEVETAIQKIDTSKY